MTKDKSFTETHYFEYDLVKKIFKVRLFNYYLEIGKITDHFVNHIEEKHMGRRSSLRAKSKDKLDPS